MNSLENFLQNNNLQDADDIDSLLELAEMVREFFAAEHFSNLCTIINHTIEPSYYEAFSWCMSILQEELEQTDSEKTFECIIGKSIPDYDEFAKRLEIDFNVSENGVETVYDQNGEVESFFNILIYKPGYKNIRLVSAENFDVKDNDYSQYKLIFNSK